MLTSKHITGLVLLTLLWGCNWPVMKFTLREVPPLTFRALTMTGGVLALALWYGARGVSLRAPRGAWLVLVGLTLPNIVGWHWGSIMGLTHLGAGRASILAFTMPVWTVLLGAALFGQPLGRRAWLASACALGAVGLLAVDEIGALASGRVGAWGVVWLQAAAVSWALGTLLVRRTHLDMSTEALTVWMLGLGAAVFWMAALTFEPPAALTSWSHATWAALAWGMVVNFGVSQLLWFGLARELPAQASTFSLMAVPLVGVVSAALALGEVPRLTDWLAAACIAAAIAAATAATGTPRSRGQAKAAG